MSKWKPFNYTYVIKKHPWWRRLLFWLPKSTIVVRQGKYKQDGKTVSIKLGGKDSAK